MEEKQYLFTHSQLKEYMRSLMNAWKMLIDEETLDTHYDRGVRAASDYELRDHAEAKPEEKVYKEFRES